MKSVDNVIADVIANKKWDELVEYGNWKMKFKAPADGLEIKMYHAENY